MKELFSFIAIILTCVGFYPYIKGIIKNTVKPHVFSWLIWAIATIVIFFAQLQSNAGVGAIPIGISGAITLAVAMIAWLKRADISITIMDWLFFILALVSIPLWYFTADPLSAIVLLTMIDLFGFMPTIRKVYVDPHSESLVFFLIFTSRNLCVLIALEQYSVATVLFPLSVMIACIVIMSLMIFRRQQMLSSK